MYTQAFTLQQMGFEYSLRLTGYNSGTMKVPKDLIPPDPEYIGPFVKFTHVSRAMRYNAEWEWVDVNKVYERDNWVCGICNNPVDRSLIYPDRDCATLDHVIPLSRGGSHTYANSQIAHWRCNSAKRDRGYDHLPKKKDPRYKPRRKPKSTKPIKPSPPPKLEEVVVSNPKTEAEWDAWLRRNRR